LPFDSQGIPYAREPSQTVRELSIVRFPFASVKSRPILLCIGAFRSLALYGLARKLAAEFLGTFAMVFVGAGAICADRYLRSQSQPSFGPLGIALGYGLTAGVMITALAHISGGQFNPAITVGLWVMRRLGTLQSIFYCLAQLVGGLAAAYLLVAIIPEPAWAPVGLGTPDLAPDFTRWHGMVLAAAMAFVIVIVYFATVLDERGAFNKVAGFAVGLAIVAVVLVGAPFVGASAANPARTFGTALASRHWHNHGVFWIGPLFGGVVAAVVYDRLFLGDQPPA
jgi:MIP family channel proteins